MSIRKHRISMERHDSMHRKEVLKIGRRKSLNNIYVEGNDSKIGSLINSFNKILNIPSNWISLKYMEKIEET